jgi:hypothetical protein
LPVADDVEMVPREYLNIAGQAFLAGLTTIGAASSGLATPCEGWSVRDLLHHVVMGNQRTTYLLGGASHEEAAVMASQSRHEMFKCLPVIGPHTTPPQQLTASP